MQGILYHNVIYFHGRINDAFPLVYFYFVMGTGRMSNAHVAAMKICYFFPATLCMNSNQFKFMRPVAGTKFCRSDKDFSLKWTCHTKGIVAATCPHITSLRPVA